VINVQQAELRRGMETMASVWIGKRLIALGRLIGEQNATKLSAVIALKPSLDQIEEATCWLDGNGHLFGKNAWPLTGKVGAIYDIVAGDHESEPLRSN
jgi:hypothetical protein